MVWKVLAVLGIVVVSGTLGWLANDWLEDGSGFASESVNTHEIERAVKREAADLALKPETMFLVRCEPGGALAEGTRIQCEGSSGTEDFTADVKIEDNLGRYSIDLSGLTATVCGKGFIPNETRDSCVPQD